MQAATRALVPAASRAFRRNAPLPPVDERARRLAEARPMTARRAFDAGIVTNLTADWTLSPLSADGEIRQAFRNLRARSRDQERNESYGEAFFRLAEQNVIGDSGIGLQMKVRLDPADDAPDGALGELNVPINRAIERAWKKQRRKANFCVTRDMTGTDAGKVILRSFLRDGDVLIRKVPGYANRYRFAVQLLEGDYLDDLYTDYRAVPCTCPQQFGLPRCQSGTHEIRMGVELQGDWKFPCAYWLLAAHPGDYMVGTAVYAQQRIRVPVDEIIHPFLRKRPGQTRGIPAIACAMQRLHHLGAYEEAELVRARVNAAKMGFIESDVPEELFAEYFDPKTGQTVINTEPGQTEELPVGKRYKANDANGADAAYPEFHKSQLRGVSAGFGVSYTSLASNLEDVNFSSMRAGLIEEREMWKGLQNFFVEHVEREIFEAWLETVALFGTVPGLMLSELDDYTDEEAAIFKPRRWAWVDPQSEVAAKIAAIEAGLETRSNAIAETGGDLEDVFQELSYEKDLADELGITVSENDADSEDGDPEDGSETNADRAGWNPEDHPKDDKGRFMDTGGRSKKKIPRKGGSKVSSPHARGDRPAGSGPAFGSLAAAASHARGGAQPTPGHDAPHGERKARSRAEQERLLFWGASHDKLGDSLPEPQGQGSEHHVAFDAARNRYVKVTRGDAHLGYGDSYGRFSRGATPSEYLDRLATHNRLFSDDVRLESIVPAGDKLALVTSQPFIKGRVADPREITSMMESKGFEALGKGAYYHSGEGLLVSDLQPRNVKVTDAGNVHVIDSTIQRVTPEFAELVRPWFKDAPRN